jgi:deoxyxylulose-5-phosphate synthase
MVGAGRNDDYSKHDGFSHEAGDIPHILGMLPNLVMYFPESEDAMKTMVESMITQNEPSFISIPK